MSVREPAGGGPNGSTAAMLVRSATRLAALPVSAPRVAVRGAGAALRAAGGVVRTAREAAPALTGGNGAPRTALQAVTGRGRRTWITKGRAHIAIRAVADDRVKQYSTEVRRRLGALDGVDHAELIAPLHRVAVHYDEAEISLGDIIEAIEEIEEHFVEHLVSPPEPLEHPADLEPLFRTATAIAGDAIGLGIAAFGRLRRLAPLPFELDAAIAFSIVENTPRVRQVVERRLGRRSADIVLALGNAVSQGLAQSTFGPTVDIGFRSIVLSEQLARRRAWEEREADLSHAPRAIAVPFGSRPERVAPLRKGTIESYAEKALAVSLGGFGVGLTLTRSFQRASAALSAGLPKAARLGREAFAARVGTSLADRGALPVDPDALRRLDRIDTVVIDTDLLPVHGLVIDRVVGVSDVDPADLQRRATSLFDATKPEQVRRRGRWVLGPIDALEVEVDADTLALAGPAEGGPVLGLLRSDELVAVARTRPGLGRAAEELIVAVSQAGLELVVAGRGPLVTAGIGRGPRHDVLETVTAIQNEGRGVMLIGAGASPALAVADIGVGLHRKGEPAPWSADVIARDDFGPARFLVDACPVAREVSKQSVTIALAGASVGAVMAFGGILPGSSQRVMTAVNAASAVALVNGTRAALTLARRPDPPADDEVAWHTLSAQKALKELGSGPGGLSPGEATKRLGRLEQATEAGPASFGRALVDELFNPLTPVLVAGAGLSVAIGSLTDAAMVGSVVGVNAAIGAAQTVRTERAIRALAQTGEQRVRVRRGGKTIEMSTRALVPGDVIELEAGDAVPADCRIIESVALEVDESSLTGESLPVAKDAAPSRAALVAERTSMLYDATSIAAGNATAVVVAVGAATEARRSAFLAENDGPRTGVESRLQSLTHAAAPVSALSGLALVGSGIMRGLPLAEVAGAGVSLAVAAVPEGLPILSTMAQLESARRLGKRGVLVRNPRAIEALGRVDVVCFDKTGTLTEGRISLRMVSDGRNEQDLPHLEERFRTVLAAGLRATPDATNGRVPHPTDRALIEGAEEAGVKEIEGADGWWRMSELPFEPARGFHAVLGAADDGLLISVKGAPEVILPRCAWIADDRGTKSLDARAKKELVRAVDRLGRKGLRVLAVAERPASSKDEINDERVSDLGFVGFLAFKDAIRPSAAEAVDALRRAGVRVVMITGDHPSTAEGIATELGLGSHRTMTGAELDELDDDGRDRAVPGVAIFARVTPSHKVRIVRSLRRAGRVVAMTGDGANDAAAIRLADVGVAFGQESTSAARDAADLVVLDDRIETIVDAVVEGRALWTSVRDAVSMLLGGNFGEIGFTLAGSLIDGRPPLGARQLLLVNLLTDVAPALAVALRPPRRRTPEELLGEGPEVSLGPQLTRAIVSRAIATGGGAMGAWLAARATGTRTRAGSVALVALVGSQLGQTLATGWTDPIVVATGVGSAALLLGIVETPGLSQFFGCRPIGPGGLAIAGAASVGATAAALVLPGVVGRAEPWVRARLRGADRFLRSR